MKTKFKNYLLREISMNNDNIVSRLVCVVNISSQVGVLVCICLLVGYLFIIILIRFLG